MSEDRHFIVTLPHSTYYGKLGTLVGDVNYLGCASGWHCLEFDGDDIAMFTGEEVNEVTAR